jgi:hypothetical protein
VSGIAHAPCERRAEAPQSLADSENVPLLLLFHELIVRDILNLPVMIRPAFPEIRLQR